MTVPLARSLPDPPPSRRLRERHVSPLGRALWTAVLLAFLLVVNVWLETMAAQRGERLRVLRGEVDRLQQEQARLRAQVAALRAPERIERLSRGLGLTPPTEAQRAVVVVPPPPEPAPAAVDRRPWWVQLVVQLWEDLALAHEGR
ncbi:MAG: hypothetical protein QN193_04080 [Armatimonadota bacterium]|nr:hypothetical protein [Armatimonadota bacterium]MDR7445350.1 hypothetical protein [Armatimonadota bacterium]MDR7569762.1 hypothetical protein [Armatimonadota bacterium]MDR7614084.1 hypothetical protein [Armatimonadota bacterium]